MSHHLFNFVRWTKRRRHQSAHGSIVLLSTGCKCGPDTPAAERCACGPTCKCGAECKGRPCGGTCDIECSINNNVIIINQRFYSHDRAAVAAAAATLVSLDNCVFGGCVKGGEQLEPTISVMHCRHSQQCETVEGFALFTLTVSSHHIERVQ